jgi:glycosyltransferase involved in cell wall biosynthesis
MVDAFIALTEFSRDKMIEGGLSAEKVFVKPNFVSDPGDAEGGRGHYALFVGRLSGEKGIATLLAGWKETQGGVLLKIAGDGPLKRDVVQCAAAARIEYLGAQPRQKILRLMRDAAFLVFPSIWYEGLPMVILEAFSVGLPVIASNLGSVASLVEHGRTGLHFRPGNARDLAEKIEWALGHPREIARMRHEARAEYLAKYTSKRNYEMLMEIYTRVTRQSISPNVAVSHAEFSG